MLNFGVIGTSWITDTYIKGAKNSGLWNLNAVYSRTEERAREYARIHSAPHIFTDINEMSKSDLIDAVYIASPNSLHFEHCKVFLENGKHVICEKPLCAQYEKAKYLFELAEKNGLIFMEAIMFMHMPQRKIFDEYTKKLGDISLVRLDYCQRSSKLDAYLNGDNPNIFNPDMETGSFMDLGIYCVYPALYLFGMPDSFDVTAKFLESGADYSGAITLNYKDKIVILTHSKTVQGVCGSEILGENGSLRIGAISLLSNMDFIDKDGSVTKLYSNDEKFKLMGCEAKSFYNFINYKDDYAAFYKQCSQLCLMVCDFMEKVRNKAGIVFKSDK